MIDTIPLLSPITGIGRYTLELAKRLQGSRDFDLSYFYGYYSKELLNPIQKSSIKSFKAIVSKNLFLKRLVKKLLVVYSRALSPQYDLYWQPNFIPNDGIRAKKVITSVHDFSFILYRDFHPKERIKYFDENFFKNIYKSDYIITGSNYTKKEILKRINYDEEHIKVIYHGIDHNIFRVRDKILLDLNLPKKFILSVGSIEPRKNLLNLLKAYEILDTDIKQIYKLVLVGFKGWENDEIMQIVDKNKEDICYLGFVSDEELSCIYNLSTLFVYPSFYEGFGLPVLEAMACGVPVVCSDTTSLPEVGGDAVVYCNPEDMTDIKKQMTFVLKDKDLRCQMVKKGIDRASLFSWERSADEHKKIFKKVLED